MLRAAILITIVLAQPLSGLAADEPGPTDEPIPLAEWRAMTTGRTVYYYIDGTFFGREFYWPERDVVTFQHASGQCSDAQWDYNEGVYCFYFDRAHCFAHVRRGERIMIIPQSVPEDGLSNEQEVLQITQASFSCAPGLSS
ncbi:MAG: hypothetical protein AAGC92_01900 [Pseudomonadota bacterium]